jgi:hypothetical protein
MWLRRSTSRPAEYRTIAGKSGHGECRPVRAASIGVRAASYVGRWRSGGLCSRNMLVNSCIGANRLLLMRARCVPRSDRATDQWSLHCPIDIHCNRLSGRIFGISLRRGEMPAMTRAPKLALRSVWLTSDGDIVYSARQGGAALRTDRCGCGNAWCSSQKVRDLAHDHTGEPGSRRARKMRM